MDATETASLTIAAGTSEPARGLPEAPMLIPVPRAAQLLGISRSAACRCVACGDLTTTHSGDRVYVVLARLQGMRSA